jgi:formate dehydrogenase major subunit
MRPLRDRLPLQRVDGKIDARRSRLYDSIAEADPERYDRCHQRHRAASDGTDQPLLYRKEFALPGGKARLFPLAMSIPTDRPDEQFDLHLNNGRILEHFHEGNLTYRSNGIREKVPDAWVEISPELARERGVKSGTWVQLISRYGRLRIRALVTDRVTGKELYMPMNSTESPMNLLTSSYTDAVTDTPAYKEASVRMVVLDEAGKSPLPKGNSRFHHPTPQRGVEVERKWKTARLRNARR